MKCISLSLHISLPTINTFEDFYTLTQSLGYIYFPTKNDFEDKLRFFYTTSESLFLMEYDNKAFDKKGYADLKIKYFDNRYEIASLYKLPSILFNNFIYEFNRISSICTTTKIQAVELLYLSKTIHSNMRRYYKNFLEQQNFKFAVFEHDNGKKDYFLAAKPDKMGNIFALYNNDMIDTTNQDGQHLLNTVILIDDEKPFNPQLVQKYGENFIKLMNSH